MLNINDIIIDRNQPEYRLIDVRIIVAESKFVCFSIRCSRRVPPIHMDNLHADTGICQNAVILRNNFMPIIEHAKQLTL